MLSFTESSSNSSLYTPMIPFIPFKYPNTHRWPHHGFVATRSQRPEDLSQIRTDSIENTNSWRVATSLIHLKAMLGVIWRIDI